MTCPNCGTGDQQGNFCSHCGAALPRACPSCDEPPLPGGRFCTRCGEALIPRQRRWPYYVAAAAAVAVVLVLFVPRQAERAGPPRMTTPATGTAGGGAAGAGGAAGVRLSGDMRENADRLFNRIMAAAERRDREEVARFMPMAVQAYESVPRLDEDGLYHLAILHLTAGDHERARVAAERILERSPDHVLALGVAARAAAEAGEHDAARSLYGRLLEVYPTEAARPLPEYADHRPMLAEYRQAAREYLGRQG